MDILLQISYFLYKEQENFVIKRSNNVIKENEKYVFIENI